MAAAVLSSFVSVRFRELHYVRDHDGSTNLDALYDACCAAGLVAVRGGGARERYEAVFDVSLDNALGPFVLDYVEEVCGDRLLTSDDPGLAAILDGEFVASFVAKKMASIEASLVAALKSEAQFGDFVARSLNRDLGKVSLLKSVLEALQRIRGGAHDGGGPAASVRPGVDAELRQAALLQRCFQVLAWCTRAGLHCQPHTGRYSSLPEWMRAVHTRRAGRPAGSTLFLDDMLSSLRIDGAYPFSSLQNMLFMLFLTVREDDDAAWNTKLALLTYYLLDLDYMQPNGALASSLRSTFGAPAPLVACWQCLFLLDCVEQPSTSSTAVITRPSSSIFPTATNAAGSAAAGTPLLQQACALLSQQVQAVAPFKVIQVLVDLGQAGVALTLHRAQSGLRAGLPLTSDHSLSAPDSLSAARTLVGLRLRCGLLTDAFLAMRAHVDGLGGDGGVRAAHTGELVVQIASWVAGEAAASASSSSSAGAAGASSAQLPASPFPLAALVELPWSAEEEDALVGWLAGQLAKGRPAGELLPVYFLGRGRVLESVGAYNRWQLTKQAGGGGGGGGGSDASALCDAMVNAAAALLPMPQGRKAMGC